MVSVRKGCGPFKGTGAWLTGALAVEKQEVNSVVTELKPERCEFLVSLSTKWTPVWRENTSVRFYSQRCTGSLCLCLNGTWLLAISARFTGPLNIYKQSPFMKLLKYAFIYTVSFSFCLCRPPRLTTWSNLCSSPLCYWQVKKQNPNSQMFERLLNASHHRVRGKNKTKQKPIATGLKPVAFRARFHQQSLVKQNLVGLDAPKPARRHSRAMTPLRTPRSGELLDVLTHSAEEIYLVSLWHLDVRLIWRGGAACCCFSPVTIGLLFGYFLNLQVYEYDLAFY